MPLSTIPNRLYHYSRLMRFHKPIGIFLLLWPTLVGVWVAGNGDPSVRIIIIFVLGVVVMRAAGCVINDIADRKYDGFVVRTHQRPLVIGQVSLQEAKILFAVLILIAGILVAQTNLKTIGFAMVALLLASLYPFTKRITYLPQVVLGAAFAWSIPMAYTAQQSPFSSVTFLLYGATLFWTVAFDTMYAMTDRNDDLKIGIKSTAILFENYDRLIIAVFQGSALLLLWGVGILSHFKAEYTLGLLCAGSLFLYQQWLIRARNPERCFQAFLNNQWVGASIFLGVLSQ
ncbi:MAG: 4-hydroxybenzoate octaprenyltransferase [Gammaproteobacteria bacterium]|nr:4-hydroxybenzoate octaprenyltransferase [Gammaproteobacteria bacterium]